MPSQWKEEEQVTAEAASYGVKIMGEPEDSTYRKPNPVTVWGVGHITDLGDWAMRPKPEEVQLNDQETRKFMGAASKYRKQYSGYSTIEGYLKAPYRRIAWETDPEGFYVRSGPDEEIL
ncbi:hypothetical protein PHISCL_04806 [Aspergillus sclerotialis]|uniref:Uncharacterized protein n=1 Tax=Aspergillus sclerotialis TaxID=2070753 RepID=A0A3A3A0L6_9EURO|nr:hypothetical protein PHISCL_04806 [Aspergillus sclerotialis]